jgi:hypothetical protein
MKAKKTYAKGGPITPDPKKKMMTADEKFNAAARSREAENLTEMRNALKEEGKEAVAKFDKELKAKGYKVISRNVKKMPGGGMMPKYKDGGKMYLKGGQVKLDKNKDGKISGEDFKMMKKYQVGGVTPKDKMIEDEIKATRVVSAAVPNRQDLEAAYKATQQTGADGTVSFEDFLKKGVDDADIRKIKNSAYSMATARQKAQDKAKTPAQRSAGQKSRLQTGESIGSSVRPGSGQGEIDADESNRARVDGVMEEMLRKMGYKR